MAACGSLRHLFQRPRPENPTLMESLSWSQINAQDASSSSSAASFTEIFGELHFDERRSAAWPAHSDRCPSPVFTGGRGDDQEDARFLHPSSGYSPMAGGGEGKSCRPGEINGVDVVPRMTRSESLRLCTEGLGSESSDVLVEDPKGGGNWMGNGGGGAATKYKRRYSRTMSDHVRRRARGEFPPPISCIGSGGRPCVSFRSYREGGRFVLREVRIPAQELLSASREGGRLKLRFVQRDEQEPAEPEEEDQEDQEDQEEGAGGDEESCGDVVAQGEGEVVILQGHGS